MHPRRILVFRIGQLGDTIVSLPAMWALREHFPDADLTLLCDRHPHRKFVLAADLLTGTGIFSRFISYRVDNSMPGRWRRGVEMVRLLVRLRRQRFDTLAYLAPSARTRSQVYRDRRFFAAAGITHFIGMSGFPDLPAKIDGMPLGATAPEADLLLARLEKDGIPVPAPGKGSLDLGLGDAEEEAVRLWRSGLSPDGGRPWIAIGPGSKMPAKRWPAERFGEVVAQLITRFDVWPVVFGGEEDRPLGERLLRAWGRGYNAAGVLAIRAAAVALEQCLFYLGNDTGTMHLAATVGIPCVALFSARDRPGMWFPYGARQRVFRSQIDCEGCGLMECVERRNECLQRIRTDDVLEACEAVLTARARPHTALESRPTRTKPAQSGLETL